MRMRRVVVTFEVETNVSIADLKAATITVPHRGRGLMWNLKRDRNSQKDVDRIAEEFPDRPIVFYLQANGVKPLVLEELEKRTLKN